MRIKHSIQVRIAKDTTMKKKQFYPEDGESEVIIDNYTKQCNGDLAIPKNTNENVPTGDITLVKGCYLEFDQDVKLKINGSTDEIQLRRAGSASTDVAKFFAECDITSINVAAPTELDVTGTYCLWGDVAT